MMDIGNVFPGLIFRRCDYRIGEMNEQILFFKLYAAARTISTNAPLEKILEILKILIQNHNTGHQMLRRKKTKRFLFLRHIGWKHFFGQLPVVILFVFVYLLGWSWTMLPSLYRF